MSLEEKIQDQLVADTKSILDSNLERVGKLFQFHEDGSIDIKNEYRDADPPVKILIYLVAQRYGKEGGIVGEETLGSKFFYERISGTDSTVRNYFQSLRNQGFIKKEGKSDHRLVVENLPVALDYIEGEHQ